MDNLSFDPSSGSSWQQESLPADLQAIANTYASQPVPPPSSNATAHLVWLIPVFASSLNRGLLFDITAMSFIPGSSPAVDFWFQHDPGGSPHPIPLSQFAQQIMLLSRADVPPASLLNGLLWNRLFFLGLALALLYLTILGVQRARQNA